eukprot:IDg1361t1
MEFSASPIVRTLLRGTQTATQTHADAPATTFEAVNSTTAVHDASTAALLQPPMHYLLSQPQAPPASATFNMCLHMLSASESRLWKTRQQIIADQRRAGNQGIPLSLTRVTRAGFKRVYVKARSGRGRKRAAWVAALHDDLLVEFERLRKSGLKFNARVLRLLAVHMINVSNSDLYHTSMRDQKSGKTIVEMITPRWIQAFMNRHQIVSRAQTGKLMLAPEKQAHIEHEVAYRLGDVARDFHSGLLDEGDVCNADETHFLINLDNHKTLGRCGQEEVKYSDVVSGSEGMIMMVRISGGRDAMIEAPFLIFQNANRSYPIQRVPDNVPSVSYRSGPKVWMDRVVLPQYFEEKKVIKRLPHARKRVMFVDNCSGHGMTPALETALQSVNTEKLKDAWRARWDKYKMDVIMADGFAPSSGKIPNPGKASANLNGQWEERQLFPKLQEIVRKYRTHFDGAPVVDCVDETAQ